MLLSYYKVYIGSKSQILYNKIMLFVHNKLYKVNNVINKDKGV